MYLKAAAQCAVQQPFLRGDDSIRFGTELRGRSVLFLQKRDRFWQNREFSTNKLGLLTIYKSVIVPNTDNMKGLEAAAAAGIVAGKHSSSATHRTRHTILSKYLLVDMILTHIIAVIADESGVFHSRHFRKRVYEIGAFVL